MDEPQSVVKYSAPISQQYLLNNSNLAEHDGTNLPQDTAIRGPELYKEVAIRTYMVMYVRM